MTSVAPASRADSTPLPKPPTQKNGIGRYSRVSASMQRAARPDRTAASALPCEWITPFGGPLLPEVNMMTSVSLGVTAAATASTTCSPHAFSHLLRRPNLPQRSKFGGIHHVRQIVEIAMAAELLDRDQNLHGGDP